MSTALLSIEQIKTMPEMVIPGVEGTLVDVKEYKRDVGPKKTTVQSFKIQQGNHWILGDAWGMADLTPWRGQHVIFVSNKAGNNKLAGVSIKEKPSLDGSKTYKNLSISSTATMHDKDTYEASKGTAPTTAPIPQPSSPNAPFVANQVLPPHSTAQQAPFAPKPPVAPAQTPVPQISAPSYATAINGQTVGMAVKAAIDILIKSDAFEKGVFDSEKTAEHIHVIASTIIGVSQRLERGDLWSNTPLADVPHSMNPGYTKADTAAIESFENALPAKRPTPGHGGTAFNVNSQDEDPDNIPF